ncbi:unnamed protein product [Linum tenue]|uniref:Uncharacterized protein n=1 Tax=Linum tenue TaxID=586396 RepID=A0AAV0NRJ0_9ROSI|nr:unnamed protein product [Linum tenue]
MGDKIYDPQLYIDHGPRDAKYLPEQATHRSRAIWHNNPESLLPVTYRGSTSLPAWHDRLSPYLERTGLDMVRHFMQIQD